MSVRIVWEKWVGSGRGTAERDVIARDVCRPRVCWKQYDLDLSIDLLKMVWEYFLIFSFKNSGTEINQHLSHGSWKRLDWIDTQAIGIFSVYFFVRACLSHWYRFALQSIQLKYIAISISRCALYTAITIIISIIISPFKMVLNFFIWIPVGDLIWVQLIAWLHSIRFKPMLQLLSMTFLLFYAVILMITSSR